MNSYVIKKVLNNNVVIAQNNDNNDVILVGKGIGFDLKKGSSVPNNRVENLFINAVDSNNHYDKILQNIDKSIVGISEEIISICEETLNIKLNQAIHVSLPDHINFAMRRLEKGIKIENPFIEELAALYPKEFDLASKSVSLINTRFNIELPQDEIGFICLHINAGINSEVVSNSLAYTKKIGQIMDLISKLMKKNFDKTSMEYVRTVTHIKFMLERILQNKTINNLLLDSIKKELYNEYNIALKVAIKIENLFSAKVPEDEIGYIALHLRRLSEI